MGDEAEALSQAGSAAGTLNFHPATSRTPCEDLARPARSRGALPLRDFVPPVPAPFLT